MANKRIPINEIITCAVYADAGFTGRFIADSQNLTVGQAYYRVRKAGRKISDYRNGKSWAAKRVIKDIVKNSQIMQSQERKIKAHFKKLNFKVMNRNMPTHMVVNRNVRNKSPLAA